MALRVIHVFKQNSLDAQRGTGVLNMQYLDPMKEGKQCNISSEFNQH